MRGPISAWLGLVLVASGLTGLAPASGVGALGPEQVWETGVVEKVSDGDTIFVNVLASANAAAIAPADLAAKSFCDNRVNPDGTLPLGGLHGCRVRTIGVQAPEKPGTEGSAIGQCGGREATARLTELLPVGTAVQLRAINVTSTERQYQGGRIARSIYYQPVGSTDWIDVTGKLYEEGLVMWMPLNLNDDEKPEYTHNLAYRQLFEAGAAARVGLFASDHCGTDLPADVSMYVVADPPGDDAGHEYVIVSNRSAAPLDVSGWTLRDSSFVRLTFPAGTVIAPGDYLRVYDGYGTPRLPTYHDFYFGNAGSMFANYSSSAGYFYGDAVYLYQAQAGYEYGSLRSWYAYPCLGATCTSPLAGKLTFATVVYDPPGTDTAAGEYAEIRNNSAETLSLAGYQFRRQNTTYQFAPESTIAAGASLRVQIGIGVDTATDVYLQRTASLLSNSGDQLFLEHVNSAVVDCRAWGTFTCPTGVPTSVAPTPTLTATPVTSVSAQPTPTQPNPVVVVPASGTGAAVKVSKKATAPQSVSVTSKSRRLVVRWAAPSSIGASAVNRYRARAYLKVGKKYQLKATCYAKKTKLTCTTKKLRKSKTYYVQVAARNSSGYGTASTKLAIRNK